VAGRGAGRADLLELRGELVVPASNSSPPIRMPLTSAADGIVLPPLDTGVAMPGPSTTVSGLVTLIVPLIWCPPAAAGRRARV
jgi:hypothetical protein